MGEKGIEEDRSKGGKEGKFCPPTFKKLLLPMVSAVW